MELSQWKFHRLFSKTMYKNVKLPLGEMTFTQDFVADSRGDMYPLIAHSEDCAESVENNAYRVQRGFAERCMGGYFPWASYEVTASSKAGQWGFSFYIPDGKVTLLLDGTSITFTALEQREKIEYETSDKEITLIVSCRGRAFDIYVPQNGKPCFVHTFKTESFTHATQQKVFERGYVSLYADGEVTVKAVSFYMDCGVSQADMRHIRYENGEVMVQNGKVYLSMSVRLEEGTYQGIFSWIPGTSEFQLVGALFFDTGDGSWCSDVASSILYHREKKMWYLWYCSFSHGHIPGYAAFKGDPRFGINVVDTTLLEKAGTDHVMTDFVGFEGDEDPDFYYDEQSEKWRMAICRIDRITNAYQYVFFESDDPFTGYTYVGIGYEGCETGGSFAKLDDECVFACGNSFEKRADYRIYHAGGMQEAKFDFDDGGFRGWGTIIPVEKGSRTRYFWLTFDRHRGSSWNWSYGNLYCFEAVKDDS